MLYALEHLAASGLRPKITSAIDMKALLMTFFQRYYVQNECKRNLHN